MEAPSLRVETELQLPAYGTATAMQDLSFICDLHHSLQERQILNPLSEVRDWTHILMDTSQDLNPLTTMGTPPAKLFNYNTPWGFFDHKRWKSVQEN